MAELPAAEPDADFDLIACFEELGNVFRLDFEVVDIDHRGKSHFFDLGRFLVLAGFFLLLALFESILAIVHDTAYRRISFRGNIDQVIPGFFCHSESDIDRNDADLIAVFIDQSYFFGCDVFVDKWFVVSCYGGTPPYYFAGIIPGKPVPKTYQISANKKLRTQLPAVMLLFKQKGKPLTMPDFIAGR